MKKINKVETNDFQKETNDIGGVDNKTFGKANNEQLLKQRIKKRKEHKEKKSASKNK